MNRTDGKGLTSVILVGGFGTRLRPLTNTVPKPMLPLLGRPLLSYTFDHLRSAGVARAILACGYIPTAIEEYFGAETDGLALEYRVEPEPLGTGGAIRFAATGEVDSTFLALNGDSLREVDIEELLRVHRDSGATATILLTRVSDPSRYGLVRTDGDGRVLGFLEKPDPSEIDTDLINAGLYVLEPEVLDLIEPGTAVSIERDVFPRLAERGELFAKALPGYWLDVGTPESYLQAHLDLLGRHEEIHVHPNAVIDPAAALVPPVRVDAAASIGAGARIGPSVHIGDGASVAAGAFIRNAAILPRAVVEAGAELANAIVAPGIGALPA
jgi:mannose-1-phosphate guanylyltransferase